MTLLVCAAMLVATSLLATWALGARGIVSSLVAAVTLGSTVLVGLTLLLSLFSAYGVTAMVVGQVVVLAGVLAWWLAVGGPRPARPELPPRAELWARVRAHGTVSVLLAAAGIAAVVELVLGLAIAPNTWDSQMYHLSRVALWIQDGGVFGLDSGTAYEREYAPNGEITYGWTVLLWDGDRFAAVIPWLFSLASGALVYEGARFLRFARAPALFAGAMFLLLPQTLVQASSTLIDMQAAFFVGVFALYGARAFRDTSRSDIVIAALALGLAIGTKGTFVIAIPGLLAIAIAVVVRWKPPRALLLRYAAVLAAGVALLGSAQYLVNIRDSGTPQGIASTDARRDSSVVTTSVRTAASFIDMPGMGGTLPAQVNQGLHDRIWPNQMDPFNDTIVSEDGMGFGPQVPLLLLPLLLYFLLARGVGLDRRLTAFASLSSFAAYAVLFEPAFNTSHVLVTGVVIGAPLFAKAAEISWIRHLSAAVAICFAIIVLTQNQLKPLYPDPPFDLSRAEQLSLQHEFAPALERIDEVIPSDARLAYIGPRGATWDYPFFGPNLDRYVYRLEATSTPTRQQVDDLVADHDLDAVVFAGVGAPPGLDTMELGEIAFSDHQVWLAKPESAPDG